MGFYLPVCSYDGEKIWGEKNIMGGTSSKEKQAAETQVAHAKYLRYLSGLQALVWRADEATAYRALLEVTASGPDKREIVRSRRLDAIASRPCDAERKYRCYQLFMLNSSPLSLYELYKVCFIASKMNDERDSEQLLELTMLLLDGIDPDDFLTVYRLACIAGHEGKKEEIESQQTNFFGYFFYRIYFEFILRAPNFTFPRDERRAYQWFITCREKSVAHLVRYISAIDNVDHLKKMTDSSVLFGKFIDHTTTQDQENAITSIRKLVNERIKILTDERQAFIAKNSSSFWAVGLYAQNEICNPDAREEEKNIKEMRTIPCCARQI